MTNYINKQENNYANIFNDWNDIGNGRGAMPSPFSTITHPS
jgi:hypothetical protein